MNEGLVTDAEELTVTMQCLPTGSWSGSSAGCFLVKCQPPIWNESAVVVKVLSNPTYKLGILHGLGTVQRFACKYQAEDFHFGRNILSVDFACGDE